MPLKAEQVFSAMAELRCASRNRVDEMDWCDGPIGRWYFSIIPDNYFTGGFFCQCCAAFRGYDVSRGPIYDDFVMMPTANAD